MSIVLNKVGSATSATASEIPAFDRDSKRLYVVAASTVNVYTVSNTGALTPATDLVAGFAVPPGFTSAPNSVSVKNGIVAVAYEVKPSTTPFTNDRGRVSFYRASDGAFLSAVPVGYLPDMLTFTPDGTKVLVANEGEPNEDYTIDPEGSVSVISINSVNLAAGTLSATVQEANFNTFDAQRSALTASGVRIIGDRIIGGNPVATTVSQDVEPEYIAISADGLTAKITLQENNAIATLDIATATITEIKPLGLKNFNLPGNGLDASDRDVNGTASGGGKINIQNWPVFGAYMPDAIASFAANGQTYYITANEGDSRVRPTTGTPSIFNEETRVASITLDPTVFPNAATLQNNANLGRLTVTNKSGNTDGDPEFEQIVTLGGRSFSIWDANGTQVFDSGDQLEQITAQQSPTFFNSDGLGTPDNFDTRSDNKGPEPEGVTIGVIGGRTYAFIGLERVGDVIVYDVTTPTAPTFVQYINLPEDTGVEGLVFVSADDSPTGKPLIITANEVSKTVSVFETSNYTLQLLHYYGESGLLGVKTAPIMGALIDKFDDQFNNTIKLGEGDTYIPGPWLIGGADPSLNAVAGIGTTALGRPDIAIFNAFGTDVSSLGNHEFDLGSPVFQAAITPAGTGASAWVGAQFPFVATNLDFAADSSLRGIADASLGGTATNAFAGKEANTIKAKIAPYTVITKGGEKIGIVGATTYDLLSKSSPNGTKPKDDGNISTSDLQEVAAYIQASVEALKLLGVNKIILVDQLDTIDRNKQLAPLVSGIDVMVAGGGHERLGDANDVAVAFNGHDANFVDTYPILAKDKDGKDTLIVTTDTEFSYLGRLVVEFDGNGEIIVSKLDPVINGAYAANEATLQKVYGSTQTADQIVASSAIGSKVAAITNAIDNVIISKDSNIFGYTKVYLEGDRVFGRAQEVNLGDISADANIYKASQALGKGVVIASLKNGGGLRASVGSVGETGEKLPPSATSVKPAGGISQLDIENALRFDNKLMVFDATPQGLLNILNYAAGLAPGNGGYAQIGGVRFSYDPTKAVGQRVQDVAIYDINGRFVANVVDNGVVLQDAPAKISVVVLNFTANGGDGYPIKANADNFRYLLDNGTLSAPVDKSLDFTATANVPANTLGEQKAFQDFLKAFYATPQTAYNVADTPATLDQRIQNLQVKAVDTVNPLVNAGLVAVGTSGSDVLDTAQGSKFDGQSNIVFTGAGNDEVNLQTNAVAPASGNNRVDLGTGDDIIYVNQGDRVFGGDGNDEFFATGGKGGNRMSGGAGDDKFWLGAGDRALGGDGDDQFFVSSGINSGNNLLSGGAGADIFNVVTGGTIPSGTNTILDFQAGTDFIGVLGKKSDGTSFSLADLTRTGNNIAIGGSVIATLTGVDTSSLSASNFKFS
jgi:2',3'-cyclic-nucleotide 2'-phosphodiesterase (5'-nucleotidase family)